MTLKRMGKLFVLGAALVLLALPAKNKAFSSTQEYQINIDPWSCLVDPICTISRVSATDLRHMGRSACRDVDEALAGLKRLVADVEAGRVKLRDLSRYLQTAYANKERLQRILEKALSKCKDGIWIYCYRIGQRPLPCLAACNEDTTGFTCPVIFPNSIFLCTKNKEGVPNGLFCQLDTYEERRNVILHELTHLGGAEDDLDDPINAHALETILSWLKAYPTKVSTLTEWGLIALGILLAGSLVWMIRRRVVYRPSGA